VPAGSRVRTPVPSHWPSASPDRAARCISSWGASAASKSSLASLPGTRIAKVGATRYAASQSPSAGLSASRVQSATGAMCIEMPVPWPDCHMGLRPSAGRAGRAKRGMRRISCMLRELPSKWNSPAKPTTRCRAPDGPPIQVSSSKSLLTIRDHRLRINAYRLTPFRRGSSANRRGGVAIYW
jgi:hypothetical protein